MALDISSLRKAIKSLKSSINVALSKEVAGKKNNDLKETVRAGVIKNFEFTYELCWKFMKRWLEKNVGSAYIDGITRKELFRLGSEHHLISNIDNWMEYHDMRNETAHTYDDDTAKEVFESAIKFLKDAEILLKNLKTKND